MLSVYGMAPSDESVVQAESSFCYKKGPLAMISRDAESLLKDLNITEPRAIDIEAIAQYCGATVVYETLEGSDGRLIGYRDRAIITVNRRDNKERQRFSAAHELGHWMHHRGKVAFACDSQHFTSQWTGDDQETIANQYAAELLLPTFLFKPMAIGKPIIFGTVKALAAQFQTSLTTTAIRLVELATTPSMVICSGPKARNWFIPNPALEAASQWPRRTLSPESLAYGLLHGKKQPTGPVDLPASTWFGGSTAKHAYVTEDSLRITPQLVLTLLTWQAVAHPSSSYDLPPRSIFYTTRDPRSK